MHFAPKSIDVKALTILYLLCTPILSNYQDKCETVIAAAQGKVVVSGSSVRSLFAAHLIAKRSLKNRHIIFTAITLGDMAEIAQAEGYAVSSVGIDDFTQQPDLKSLKSLLIKHPGSVVVLTPLFGAVVDYTKATILCRQYGAEVIVDNAQGFHGIQFRDYNDYDVMLWSFGPIKTMTALGGGIGLFSDAATARLTKNVVNDFARSSNIKFRMRLLKYLLLVGLSRPFGFTAFIKLLSVVGADPEKMIKNTTKAYSSQSDLIKQVKKKPCLVQQKLFFIQLKYYDEQNIYQRANHGYYMLNFLGKDSVFGVAASGHSFWLVPLLCDSPKSMRSKLLEHGFYASPQTSTLIVLNPRQYPKLQTIFSRVIYVPVDHTIPEKDFDRLCHIIKNQT